VLVRHGETRTYDRDAGLTPRGEQQARARGAALARDLAGRDRIVVRHAPTERARQTAEALRSGLIDASGPPVAGAVRPDPAFGNFGICCGDTIREPSGAHALYEDADHAAPAAGWLTDYTRYLERQHLGSDPVGYWLRQPLPSFEPPVAVVHRFGRAIAEIADAGEVATATVVATHSGCLRAIVAAASGEDRGEPERGEAVHVFAAPGRNDAMIRYRDRVDWWLLPRTTPPWLRL
jgi:broad specificity phosphatase PhoE